MAEQPSSTVPHYEILKHALPDWLGAASALKRNALAQPAVILADGFKNASEQQHQALKRLNSQAWSAQNRVDQAMERLKSPEVFAAEILQTALKDQYGLEPDVRNTYLQLYIPLTLAGFTLKPGAARTWSVSLLDAALHNFEESETAVDGYDANSGFTTRPGAGGQFQPLPAIGAKLSIAQFTTLCRTLDIGERYQRYLSDYLGLDNPVAQASLQHTIKRSHLASLELALYMAVLKQDLPQASHDTLMGLLQGQPSSANGCKPLLCYELVIMSTRLTGIVLFAEDLDASRQVVPVIAWIPDDPEHPIKQYPSTRALMLALCEKLRTPDYQRFFSRFIGAADLSLFFADLNQRLTQVTWHAHIPGDPLPSWRQTPVAGPNLQFRAAKIERDLFEHLYQMKLSKLLDDARSRAVSTASTDRKARWERWALIEKVGSTLLQIIAFIAVPFVPPLGALMLGYTAYQVLDDAFEGAFDWVEGLQREALGHTLALVEQLVQLGMFAIGIPIAQDLLRAALPAELSRFFERLKPVTRPDGSARLWQPDLAPYRRAIKLPKGARPDEQGLYQHHGESILRLGEEHYAVHHEAESARYTLKHPERASAYRPQVMTNGEGAWVTELERPLSWDSPTLMRRLGYRTEGFSDSRLQQARRVSDTHDNGLRHLHLNQQPAPPLLADTLKRFRIDQDLQDFITQMNSDDPAISHQADAQTQLQLLVSYGLWPQTKTLRFLDAQGHTLWEFARTDGASVVQVHQAQMKNGDLLQILLESLDEQERKTLLEEPFGTPPASAQTRAKVLRKKLARLAYDKRFSLFDSRYRGEDRARHARVQKILDAAPEAGLPTSVGEEILASASGEELRAIDAGNLPKRLRDLAHWGQQEVRTTRAYEGLYLETVESPDTATLALHSLENLPGWQPGTRLEVRQYRIDGALLDAIGPPDAQISRTLVATADGQYIPYADQTELFGQSDVYTAILQALPDSRRTALNLHIGQGERLKQTLAEHALGRDALRRLLDTDPAQKPEYDPKFMRLRGGDAGYRAVAPLGLDENRVVSAEELAHDLLPALSTAQIRELVQSLESQPGGALATLLSLQTEYLRMTHDLARWVGSTPRLHPQTGAPLSAEEYDYARRDRRLWAHEIQRAWRRETEIDDHFETPARNGHRLSLPVPLQGPLPQLRARFSHVSLLELQGNHSTQQVEGFLRLFPRLRHLTIRHVGLEQLPAPVFSMPHLNELILSDCHLTLTAEQQTALSAMSRLVTLDLYKNPLNQVPSVERMPDLRYLDLSRTGISALPRGLLNRPSLELALLSQNQLRELPDALFNLPAASSDKFDLSANPLTQASMERVKAYYHRTGKRWEIDAPLADLALAKQLYPSFSNDEINHFVFALPGDLEAGRLALMRFQIEYQAIRTDMTPWANDPLASHAERINRARFIEAIEAGWRREVPLDPQHHGIAPGYALTLAMPVSGTLATLRITLPHVTALVLEGSGAPLQPGSFLQAFPGLKRLTLDRYALAEFPLGIASLRQLTYLRLRRNGLRLSPTTANALAAMSQLESLDLSHNPLGEVPDVRRLNRLGQVSLSNTGLTHIPASLLSPATPRTAIDLSHNQITQVPAQLFTLRADLSAAFDLSNNPLSAQTLQQVKIHFQGTDNAWKISPPYTVLRQLKTLYPSLTDTELGRIFFQLPGDIDAALPAMARLKAEYHQMSTRLQEWVLNVPERDPILDTVLDMGTRAEEQLRRAHFKDLLERCWRRETELDEGGELPPRHSYKLVFHAQLLGDLPQLNAQLPHVTLLELIGERSNQSIDELLRCLPNLTHLTVERYALGDIPEPIFSLQHLRQLSLSDNRIQLTPRSKALLAGMGGLEHLDMSDNMLGMTPDVRNLSRLKALYLHNCGLSEVPESVFGLGRLQALDLSSNLIQHLPSDLLEMPLPLNDDSDLSDNPLSAQSLALLRRYYQQTGYELGVEEAMEDEQGFPLAPPDTPVDMEE